MPRRCDVRRLATVTYENGLAMQTSLVFMRQRDQIPDQLLLLQHTPVITTTRLTPPEHVLVSKDRLKDRGIALFETNRGGDVTYHGPGQLVGYPLLHLGEGRRDVRKFVTDIEEVLIRTVAEFGIESSRRDGAHGVWVGDNKIAAIGVRIARWVTSHGFALNVTTDLSAFSTITPCGLSGTGVTSIEHERGSPVPMSEVEETLLRHFAAIFERELHRLEHEIRVVKVVLHDNERFLLLKRLRSAGGFWQPVTGVIEDGESAREAAVREVLEETGFASNPSSLGFEQSFLISPEFLDSKRVQPIFADETCFVARIGRGVEITLDQEEHEDYGWFTLDEAVKMLKWSDDREALERVARGSLPGTTV